MKKDIKNTHSFERVLTETQRSRILPCLISGGKIIGNFPKRQLKTKKNGGFDKKLCDFNDSHDASEKFFAVFSLLLPRNLLMK